MAQPAYLWLKANGADVQGEVERNQANYDGAIEVVSFVDDVTTARERGSGMATGERRFAPLRCRKRIDKSTPLIQQALSKNEAVEGKIMFERPTPAGDGTTQHYFTIEFSGGRVDSIQRSLPDTIDPASSAEPMTEWVGFVFERIVWRHEIASTEFEDTWRSR